MSASLCRGLKLGRLEVPDFNGVGGRHQIVDVDSYCNSSMGGGRVIKASPQFSEFFIGQFREPPLTTPHFREPCWIGLSKGNLE